jgi:hypothetical protein
MAQLLVRQFNRLLSLAVGAGVALYALTKTVYIGTRSFGSQTKKSLNSLRPLEQNFNHSKI